MKFRFDDVLEVVFIAAVKVHQRCRPSTVYTTRGSAAEPPYGPNGTQNTIFQLSLMITSIEEHSSMRCIPLYVQITHLAAGTSRPAVQHTIQDPPQLPSLFRILQMTLVKSGRVAVKVLLTLGRSSIHFSSFRDLNGRSSSPPRFR